MLLSRAMSVSIRLIRRLLHTFGALLIMNNASASELPDFDSLWNHSQPAETEAKFREILPIAQSSGNVTYLAELQTQIARTLGLQQKFAEAHALLDQVEARFPHKVDLAGAPPSQIHTRVLVRYLLERGRVFNSSKAVDKALPLFEEAWNLASASGLDFYAVDAAHMMAIAAARERVMEWNQKALALAEKSAEPKARRWRGSLYNNIGWDYFSQAKYDSALIMFEKAVTARIEQEQPTEVRIAKWCVAKTLRMLGQIDSALVIQRTLEIEWNDSDEGPDGYVFEEIAECLLIQGNETEAKPYFARAYELLSPDPWLIRDEPERLARLKQLGGVRE